MTFEEKLALVRGYFGTSPRQLTPEMSTGREVEPEVDKELPGTSGYVPGIKRLAIPALLETDGSLGIANGYAGYPTQPVLPAGRCSSRLC